MDLLERARNLAACPLFGGLAPPVVIRLAERAHGRELAVGERVEGSVVSVVASGRLRAADRAVTAGHVLGLIRVVAPATAAVAAIADEPSVIVELAIDDVRDVLEEDPTALAALVDALAALLLEATNAVPAP